MTQERQMRLMMITADPGLARVAADAGVDRIFVDLEFLGKTERQGHLDTVISRHTLADVVRIREAVDEGQLLVRVDPWHDQSAQQIDEVVRAGADTVMLPMFTTSEEVRSFVDAVGGRARTIALVETPAAMTRLRSVVRTDGLDEVYFGLNDLHLALGLDFLFEVLSGGLVDLMASEAKAAGKPFGFGGVSRVGSGELPAELVLGEHARTGSSIVILSRAFFGGAKRLEDLPGGLDLETEVRKVRDALALHFERSAEQIALDRARLCSVVQDVADRRRAERRSRVEETV
ncbi:MAG: hypothetical protein KF857_11170 [Fimbriimonadaceae bacterium]|nr:hypothetical protein [Fimbriimonadaceae bacterium]